MKYIVKLCLALSALILLFSCNKKNPTTLASQNAIVFPDSKADVYVAGYYGDTLNFQGGPQSPLYSTAMYWKNGVPVQLTNGQNDSKAYSIAISGSDVYVAGYETINGIRVATYWKNGVAVMLSNGTNAAEARAIVVSGNDVYVCGHKENSAGNSVALFWKNGIEALLSDGTTDVNAVDLYVSGSDVYVCGNEWYANSIQKQNIIWENGLITLIDSTQSYFSSITGNGNNIYLSGSKSEIDASSSEQVSYPKYWYGGTSALLDTTLYGWGNKIIVADNDIYIAGTGYKLPNTATGNFNNEYGARYWKNGIAFDLPSTTTIDVKANSIAVFNNNVYVVGRVLEGGAIWINGSLYNTEDYTVLTDIKVVPK